MWPFEKKKHPAPAIFPSNKLQALLLFYGTGMEVCSGLDSSGLGGNSITFFFHFSKSCFYLPLAFACNIMVYYSINLQSL